MGLDPEFATAPLNKMLRRESLQFHFACYALVEIGFYEDEGDCAVDSAKLIGFWLTQEEADLAARGRESRLRAEHEAQYKVINGRWPAWPFDDPGYQPSHYEIAPLSGLRGFSSLADIEEAITDAAMARFQGVRIDAAQPKEAA